MSSEYQPHNHLHTSLHGSNVNNGDQHFGPLEQLIVPANKSTPIQTLSPKNVPGPVTDL